jgi:hypothetical protein
LLDGYNRNIKDIIKKGTGGNQYLTHSKLHKEQWLSVKSEKATKRVTLLPYNIGPDGKGGYFFCVVTAIIATMSDAKEIIITRASATEITSVTPFLSRECPLPTIPNCCVLTLYNVISSLRNNNGVYLF